jgi:hypothetical protein
MKRAALVLLGLLSATPALAGARQPVDVALVLAIDVSGSVSEDNWKTQREGVASAVGSDQFAQAVRRGQIGRVAIAVIQWGTAPRMVIGWRIVENAEETRALAEEMRRMQRAESGGTCMGTMLKMVTAELTGWDDYATRRIVDVSGDGASNCGIDFPAMRAAALKEGITINGLPIVTPVEPKIADWYGDNVIGGPGAFTVVADGHHRFAEAFLRKLTVEIAALISPESSLPY